MKFRRIWMFIAFLGLLFFAVSNFAQAANHIELKIEGTPAWAAVGPRQTAYTLNDFKVTLKNKGNTAWSAAERLGDTSQYKRRAHLYLFDKQGIDPTIALIPNDLVLEPGAEQIVNLGRDNYFLGYIEFYGELGTRIQRKATVSGMVVQDGRPISTGSLTVNLPFRSDEISR